MALVLADRVRQTTTTTGQGTITLNGTVTGFQSFSAIGDGNTTYYSIVGQNSSEWEVGVGTYTLSGTTLSRDTVLSSSAGGTTKTTFSAGTKDVFVTYPSERSVYSNGTNIVPDTAATLLAISGGTGQSSYAVGDLLYASTTTALSKLADVATGNAVISGGVGVAPSYGKIGLTTHVSGTLPVANGGTGITSLGTGVATALGVNTGTAGAFVVNGGVLGTPSSGTVTNLTGTASININGTVGATTANTGAFTTLQFDSGYGSVATAYGCRAWVNFNGTGTVAIRASGNVTSITDNGTGNYTVVFTVAMPDANYATVGITEGNTGTNTTNLSVFTDVTSQTTASVRVTSINNSNTAADRSCISVSVFR